MTKIETVCIVHQPPKILLGMKKVRFGRGKYNGFGGKVTEGETIEQTAKRETLEEAGIEIINPEKMGELLFQFQTEEPDHLVHIFRTEEYKGIIKESEEMKPEWFYTENIPYKQMWADDEYWLPLLLEKRKFIGNFIFNRDFQIAEYKLKEIKCFD